MRNPNLLNHLNTAHEFGPDSPSSNIHHGAYDKLVLPRRGAT